MSQEFINLQRLMGVKYIFSRKLSEKVNEKTSKQNTNNTKLNAGIYQNIIVFILDLDMIDKVLGFDQPQPRRRKADNTSETSSKQETAVPVQSSPARSNLRKINTEESNPKEEEKNEGPVVVRSVEKPKPKVTAVKPQTKPEGSDQQIASPAVKHLKRAVVAKNVDEMRNSAKIYLRESVRPVQVQAASGNNDMMYKLKVIGFLIISLFLMLNAMTPARKVTYRRK